jgi:hypothetical protein
MAENYVQVLIDTINKKEETLRRILEITEEQEQISKAEEYDSDRMEKTLNDKEIQIARLNHLDEGFQSVYDRVSSQIRNNMEDYKDSIVILQDKIRVCTELGNAIRVLEDRNRNRLSQLFSRTKKEYSASKNKASVAQNYFKTMNNSKIMDAYFVDKKK